MDKKKGKPKAWDVMESKELEQVSRKASAAKHGKAGKDKDFTLTRIGIEPHRFLRKMASLEEIQMQELIDRLVTEYKAKYHPNL